MKKILFNYIIVQFIFTTNLFSLTLSEERFLIVNLSNEDLVINCEYLELPTEIPWVHDNNGINIIINYWIHSGETILMPSRDYYGIISYRPEANTWNDYFYFFDKLSELSLSEKMKSIFKTFSIRTMGGEYIIMEIDDLGSGNIIKIGNAYILEIHNMEKKDLGQ